MNAIGETYYGTLFALFFPGGPTIVKKKCYVNSFITAVSDCDEFKGHHWRRRLTGRTKNR
jgi:hypothetical protein